jgi:phosphoribosylaminoimidazolecarboxamide formyltransferase/IMP cyclohydrolase
VLASDGFFPKEDSIKVAYKKGIRAIIQPGGSIKDNDLIKLCDKLRISMIFTGIRHFRH